MLKEAMKFTDINKVIINDDNNSVYLEEKNMRLDVGAVAKGYATEIVANELINKGYTSFIISSGGNVRTVGEPMDRSRKNGEWYSGSDGNQMTPMNHHWIFCI